MAGRAACITELVAQATFNGYKRGAHREKDIVRGREIHVNKTKRDQDDTEALCFVNGDRFILQKTAIILTLPSRRQLTGMQQESVERGLLIPDKHLAPENIVYNLVL